ncbi:outer membrane protein TolC [Flavobacterium tiangeerense]|uniref:Outer membrane protein TolC n=1 Tax=Flavobacterium tiangeerense TaxID=459471 RepID=A0ABY3FNE3_9FLAO|nr:TolC family protein [Flavobacterium tiangeerense]TWI03206.1 outer membrane protein TolC [Flavobacterium tiangeerense]
MRNYFLFYILFGSYSLLYSQAKIKCDLIEVSSIAFNKNPTIRSANYSIQNAEADLQVQRSIFDFNLNSDVAFQNRKYNLFDADPRNDFVDKTLRNNSFDFSIGSQKRLRTGQSIDIGLKYNYNNSNFPYNTFNELVGSFYGNHSSTLNLVLTQPLLRGRGAKIVTASEKASVFYINKSKYDYEFANSLEIEQIGIAYWDYYTAYKSLSIYTQNENRVREVLNMTTELVKADKKPLSDLDQVNADLRNQERLTAVARQNLYNSRINLGRVIGLIDEEGQRLDIPVNDFPTVLESGYNEFIDKNALIKIAKSKRGDVKAIGEEYKALELQYLVATNNLRPQLNLSAFGFYGSASAGNGVDKTWSSLVNNQGQELGGGAKLSFSFPLNNNLAKGNYSIRKIALQNQTVINENIHRNIELNIDIAVNNLMNSVLILQKSKESFDFYQNAFKNEQIKFQSGLTTLLNLILFQERLTASELENLNAQQQFSNAILILRHETGTLISKEDLGFKITQNAFYTIPNKEN